MKDAKTLLTIMKQLQEKGHVLVILNGQKQNDQN